MEVALQPPQQPATPVRRPLAQRINFRILFFSAVVLFLLGSPVYIFLSEKLTGGIRNRGEYLEVDLKAMSGFEMDQVAATMSDVPEKWRNLDGKKVMLTGEVWSPREAGGKITSFQLVYSIAKCCFSGPPKVQHFIDSTVPNGKRVNVYPGLVNVLGTLHVNVKKDGGRITSVYQLDVESVEPE